MKIVKIVGKSKKGRARVRQHGDQWRVKTHSISVACLNSKEGVLLESVTTSYLRWMALEEDRDFDFVEGHQIQSIKFAAPEIKVNTEGAQTGRSSGELLREITKAKELLFKEDALTPLRSN